MHRGDGAVSPEIAATIWIVSETLQPPSLEPTKPLSSTQVEIVRLVAVGYTNREIAERVFLSENTVKSHLQEIFRKLDVRNRVEAALHANREGWI